MEVMGKSLILSVIFAVSCKFFCEIFLTRRSFRHAWISYTMVPMWTAGFLVIAYTEIPPYILQPVRLTAIVFLGAWIYFRAAAGQRLLLSVLFSVLVWICTLITAVGAGMLPIEGRDAAKLVEWVADSLVLGVVLLFHRRYAARYKGRFSGAEKINWGRLCCFPVISLLSVVTFSAVCFDGSRLDRIEVLAACTGVLAVNVAGLYFMGNMLVQEAKVQRLEQMQEQTENQMRLYESVKKSYENQRRYLHDYKNQLGCIQGLLADDQTKEAAAYIEKLTGSIRKISSHVNTNHAAVNVVLNQKYEYARDKGITMVMQANDLSGLAMDEEDIVTILVNLTDNAVEACEKLEGNRLIQLKMILEEEQFVLSVRNPVKEPVKIRDNMVITTKKDKKKHGIGLANVRRSVERNNGTCVLRCEEGWFYVSAVIPNEKRDV